MKIYEWIHWWGYIVLLTISRWQTSTHILGKIIRMSEDTTPNWIYLGGQGFSWRPKLNRQGKYNFLGGDSRQPRNIYSLAVLLGCQGNDGFTWRFHWAAKKTVHFLGGFFGSPRKKCIYLAVGSQGNNWYMHIILVLT